MPTIPQEAVIILNPLARSRQPRVARDDLQTITVNTPIVRTTGPGDAARKAAEAVRNGIRLVIAAGGDGTINEVINGIAGTEAALGILPIGSVNVLAKQLKIPVNVVEAWDVIRHGTIQLLDLVRVDFHGNDSPQTRYFIQMAGIGLDAHIVRRVTPEAKKRWGPAAYLLEFFRCHGHTLPPLAVRMDDTEPVECSFALAGNGAYYGGTIPVFHRASMTDGLMDLCLFQSSLRLDLLRYLAAVLLKKQDSTRGIVHRQARAATFTSPAPSPIELDGEFAGYLPVKFTVIPGALRVLVPV